MKEEAIIGDINNKELSNKRFQLSQEDKDKNFKIINLIGSLNNTMKVAMDLSDKIKKV